MKNNFSVYVKQTKGEFKGQYKSIRGEANAVFPFSFGQLLDEQLDEAHLVIKYSPIEYYEPLTEFKIELKQEGVVKKTLYMVVAQDKTREFPIGKKVYEHTLYLIERTKLLEGLLCQSITFTNSLGKDF